MIKQDDVIVVFLRSPYSPQIKTRLAKELGENDAKKVYQILVDKILGDVQKIPDVDKCLSLDTMSVQDVKWFSERGLANGWVIFEQNGFCLGERMHNTIVRLSSLYDRILLVGSDIADSTSNDLISAINRLESQEDIVVGPSADGGFWCLGLFNSNIDLFNGLEWSTSNVFSGLRRNIERLNLNCKTITMRRDIDTCYDIGMTTLLS
ncbi:MAG: hypothetical protein CBC29_02380 [Methylococcaceae bacterium TMED69]|nr:MAG: hypothetical protein CBC29_02380 [Methylococcaceae bacterium TMED69]|tara:strand:- start:622 stop:1242 length:621 start_codon:yes stop_codon:yes gene_type:complete